MKTLMFSLTFVVVLVLYGAGFFVPETQGIENTLDGHVVLNDAEMSQLVGGPFIPPHHRNKRHLVSKGNGEKPPDCNVAPALCPLGVSKHVIYPDWGCEYCGSENVKIYQWVNDRIISATFRCIIFGGNCEQRKNVHRRSDSCEKEVGDCVP